MSVRLVNSSMLTTASNAVIGVGQDKASVAFFLRINGPLPLTYAGWAGTILAQRGPATGKGFSATAFTVDEAAQTVTVRLYWRVTDNTAASAMAVLSPGIVYAFAMTYDKDDPSGQAFYLNGVKHSLDSVKTLPLDTTTTTLQLGTQFGGSIARDLSYEKWMWWNGYVLSTDDVLDIISGDGDPSTIGTSASWRGYWTLDGTIGDTPANGDAALSNSVGDNAYPLTTFVSGSIAGSSLAYGDAMPFSSQASYEAPIVCSSGKSIRIRILDPNGNGLTVASFGSSDPTIRINGGSPITLSTHFSENHYGAIYYLPAGYAIAPGDAVTFSAVNGFIITGLGALDGCTDLACVNKSGVPLYGDQPRTLIGGLNYTYPASSYWSYYQGPSNWAWRMLVDVIPGVSTNVREDGTLKVNQSSIQLVSTATADQIDDLSYPMPTGKWVVSYVPKDVGRATAITLTSQTPGCCSELTAYANVGSAAGDRIIRVYDVVEGVDYPSTLAGDVDATTTSIPLSSTNNLQGRSVFSGRPLMWIKIDDEYMTIESVNTSTKVATVTRGVLGSTAASHASGTSCVARYYIQNPGLYVNVSGPGGTPDYSDLVIYGPDEWTPPASPGTVTDLDTSLAAQLRPSKFIRDSMVNLRIVRHMDSTMGNTRQIAEPEYMRESSDKYWTFDAKFTQDFRVTDLKQFDPETNPYFYVHQPTWVGAETYSATLADAIDAVQTTITISDAATARVVEGSRLFIGSEQLRVTAISGTTATVVRGCMGTAAASHAAGSITVGWRVPMSSTSQYQISNKAVIELTTDRPHRLRSGMFAADPTKTDMNPLARGTVTLAADATPVTSGNQTITLTASDWTYIKSGMYIQITGGELVRITAANSSTGVCTLKSKLSSSYPSGTTGSTMACGVWCKSADGSTHAWTPKQGSFITFYVLDVDKLLVLYNVDLGGAIGVVDGDQTWDQTAAGSGAADQSMLHWKTPIQVYPYEYPPLVAAETPGSILWVNVPMMASDDVAYDIAVRTRDNLPSGVGHKIVVELANETWNGAFPCLTVYQNMGPLIGVPQNNWADTWILRTKAVTQIVKDAFAEGGHDAEVLLSLPYQAGNVDYPLSRARAVGVDVDVVGSAPYFGPAYTATVMAMINAIDDDQAVDWWLYDYECNAIAGMGYLFRDADQPARLNHETLTGRPLKFYTYEGGYSSMLPIGPNGANDTSVYPHGVERNIDLSYNPTCHPVSLDRLSVDQRDGMDGLCFFTHCQPPAALPRNSGFYHEMWGLTSHHGQIAGRGDGSDGKADNRLTLAQPGLSNTKGPLVNLHGTNVSVRLQALLDWNAAVASGGGDDGGDGGSGSDVAHSLSICFHAGSGLTLEAAVKNIAGTTIGSTIATGFSEMGTSGWYTWAGDVPGGQRGYLVIRESGGGDVHFVRELNPTRIELSKEVEIANVTSKTTQTVEDVLSAGRAYTAGKMVVESDHQTIYGPDGSVVRDFAIDVPSNPAGRT